MKVLNLKTTGAINIQVNNEEYLTDITDPLFSTEHQTTLSNLVTSLQEEGVTELHVETNQGKSFVHKVVSGDVLSSSDVNSISVFKNLQEYANDLGVADNSRLDSANAHPWL